MSKTEIEHGRTLGVSVALGAAMGAALGAATGHMGVWIAVGIAAYIAISLVSRNPKSTCAPGFEGKAGSQKLGARS